MGAWVRWLAGWLELGYVVLRSPALQARPAWQSLEARVSATYSDMQNHSGHHSLPISRRLAGSVLPQIDSLTSCCQHWWITVRPLSTSAAICADVNPKGETIRKRIRQDMETRRQQRHTVS